MRGHRIPDERYPKIDRLCVLYRQGDPRAFSFGPELALNILAASAEQKLLTAGIPMPAARRYQCVERWPRRFAQLQAKTAAVALQDC
jgi:hypothetical protein